MARYSKNDQTSQSRIDKVFLYTMFEIHNAGLELIFSLIFNEHEADLLMSYLETHVRHLAGSHSLCAAKSGLQL